MNTLDFKTKIISGTNALKELECFSNQKILIVCDKFLADNGAINQLTKHISPDNTVHIFSDVKPDPPIEVISQGIVSLEKINPDVLIGFGGGSAIDTAKAMSYLAHKMGICKNSLCVAVPTTSGTGSEVTSVTVVTETSSATKVLIGDSSILPDIALLDPQLTVSVPKAITANTGMDALTHALEAYVATGANVFSDALAEKAVDLIVKSLVLCCENGNDLNYRSDMQQASTLAGMAFNIAGLGINHSIAHQLGGVFHIPHGLANAIILTRIMDFNSSDLSVKKKYVTIARKSGISFANDDETAYLDFKNYINDLRFKLNISPFLSHNGVTNSSLLENIEKMACNALNDNCTKTTPVTPNLQDIKKLLLSVLLKYTFALFVYDRM